MFRLKIASFLIVFLFVSEVYAQSDTDLNELKQAYIYVQDGNYKNALPYFEKMHSVYPKDPTYNYFLGKCILFAKEDYDEAIPYLRFASTRNVPSDVYFYLGYAYLKNYKFEEATANFKWFEKKANNKEKRDVRFSEYKSMAQNGLYLIRYYKKLQVVSKKMVAKNDFFEKYNVKIEGNLVDRFEYFNQKSDGSGLPNVMYVPNYMENKEVLYFSAKNKKGDFDIYRITKLGDGEWSKAENLGDVINTPFDESFPFIHSDGSTLYFASKGHYSMGGYDIYKSTWDWEQQKWTEPENLDFPVNSPYDDFLFVPSYDKEFACFASLREKDSTKVTLYNIKLNNELPYVEYVSNEQILAEARLDVNYVLEEKAVKKEKKKINQVVKQIEEESFIKKNEYDSLLGLAMDLQLKSDSVKWEISSKRKEFDQTKDSEKRKEIGSEIVQLERSMYLLQKQADKCYEQVKSIEQLNLASKNISYEKKVEDQSQKVDVEDKPDRKIENIVEEPKDNDFEKAIITAEIEEKEEVLDVNFGLRVNTPSIYNPKNPIPVNGKLPDGIIYQIQLGAFSSVKQPVVFKGLEPLFCVKKKDGKIHKYYAGRFYQLKEAEEGLRIVKSKGFKDAYIVAFNSGKIIGVKSAVNMESEKSSVVIVEKETKVDSVGAAKEELLIIYILKASVNSDQLIENIKKESVGKEIYIDESKMIDNLIIKSFLTYQEADDLKQKLESSFGIRLEIHAFFAENQIPLDQARKITK